MQTKRLLSPKIISRMFHNKPITSMLPAKLVFVSYLLPIYNHFESQIDNLQQCRALCDTLWKSRTVLGLSDGPESIVIRFENSKYFLTAYGSKTYISFQFRSFDFFIAI